LNGEPHCTHVSIVERSEGVSGVPLPVGISVPHPFGVRLQIMEHFVVSALQGTM
jgi:hypothetical protein